MLINGEPSINKSTCSRYLAVTFLIAYVKEKGKSLLYTHELPAVWVASQKVTCHLCLLKLANNVESTGDLRT